MMNKSLRARGQESSRNTFYGFQPRDDDGAPKKEPPFPAALKLITGRRQTEWTGATRCPNKDNSSHNRESLIGRKQAILFSISLPCRPLADTGLKAQMFCGNRRFAGQDLTKPSAASRLA